MYDHTAAADPRGGLGRHGHKLGSFCLYLPRLSHFYARKEKIQCLNFRISSKAKD